MLPKFNHKPSVEFDEKYGTSISKTDWKFPNRYTADEVYDEIIYPIVNNSNSIKNWERWGDYVAKLNRSHFNYEHLKNLTDDSMWGVLYGMVSGYNYDDIIYFIEDWDYENPVRRNENQQIKKELIELGVNKDDIQWVISPKTFAKIKEQLTKSNTRYDDGGLIAPNGKPSNLTPEQYKLVRTPEFKAWFGDWENDPENASKVVDSNGEPLVVYHGSPNNDIKKFKSNFDGIFFTDNLKVASSVSGSQLLTTNKLTKEEKKILNKEYDDIYDFNIFFEDLKKIGYKVEINRENTADDFQQEKYENVATITNLNGEIEKYPLTYFRVDWNKIGVLQKGRNYQVFLNIRNPLKVNAKNKEWDNINYKGKIISTAEISQLTKESKNDGSIIKDLYEYYIKSDVYIVFNSNQIKLADGSNITFDSENPDIRYAGGGDVQEDEESKKEREIEYHTTLKNTGCFKPLTPFQEKFVSFLDLLKDDCISLGGFWYDCNPTNYAYNEDGELVLFDIEDFYNESIIPEFIEEHYPKPTPLKVQPFDDDNYEFVAIGQASMGGIFRDKRDGSILKLTASPFEVYGTTKILEAQNNDWYYEDNFVAIYSIENVGKGVFKGTWYYEKYGDEEFDGDWYVIKRANIIPFDDKEQFEAKCVVNIIRAYYRMMGSNYAVEIFGSYDLYEPIYHFQDYLKENYIISFDGGGDVNNKIVIRKIREEDIPEITENLAQVFDKTGWTSSELWGVIGGVDMNISVVAEYDNQLAGFYFLNENNIPRIDGNYGRFYGKKGVEGVALGVFKKFKDKGVGKKLIEYSQNNLDYDYIWGYQMKVLDNINDWLKRREMYQEYSNMYITYRMLKYDDGGGVEEMSWKDKSIKSYLEAEGFQILKDGVVKYGDVEFILWMQRKYIINRGEKYMVEVGTPTEPNDSDDYGLKIAVLDNIKNLGELNKGQGSFVLDKIIEASDKTGTTLQLFPQQQGKKGLTTKQLTDWYIKRGFVVINDENVMERKPAETKSTASKQEMYRKLIQAYEIGLEIEEDEKKIKLYQDIIRGYQIGLELEEEEPQKKELDVPALVKADALQVVLEGGGDYELDKLRNPHKKRYTLATDELYADYHNALKYAIYNGLIDKNAPNYFRYTYGYIIVHRDKEGILEMMAEREFDKEINLGLVSIERVNQIIKEAGIDEEYYLMPTNADTKNVEVEEMVAEHDENAVAEAIIDCVDVHEIPIRNYDEQEATQIMQNYLNQYRIRVIQWSRSSCGFAYYKKDKDGYWRIKVPKPTNADRFGVVMHEIYHCIDSFMTKPSYLAEFKCDKFALDRLREMNLDTSVWEKRMKWHVLSRVAMATNRGHKNVDALIRNFYPDIDFESWYGKKVFVSNNPPKGIGDKNHKYWDYIEIEVSNKRTFDDGGGVDEKLKFNYLRNIQNSNPFLYHADFGQNGKITWEIPSVELWKEDGTFSYIIVQSMDSNWNKDQTIKKVKGEGSKAINDLFEAYPFIDQILYDDESAGFWSAIGGQVDELNREDFYTYYNQKYMSGGTITNYTEFYDNLQIEDGTKYIGQKFGNVFPYLNKKRTPNDFRIDVKQHYGIVKRLQENRYSTQAMKQRDLNKLKRMTNEQLEKKKYLSGFYLDSAGVIISFKPFVVD